MTPQGYAAKLLRPEWKLKRLEILERDDFTCRWCGVSGTPLEVHHLRYTAGSDPWESPDNDLVTLCVACHSRNHEKNAPGILNMVQQFTRGHGLPITRRPHEFDNSRAWKWIIRLPDDRIHRPMMKFASWLWKTGTRDMDTLMAILEDCCKRQPASPYAYYAPCGIARDCRSAQAAIEAGERENEAYKQADRRFLAGLHDSAGA